MVLNFSSFFFFFFFFLIFFNFFLRTRSAESLTLLLASWKFADGELERDLCRDWMFLSGVLVNGAVAAAMCKI